MLATLADSPPTQGKWLYEIKWDGYRALAFCDKNKVDLISRNNKSFNEKFYPIVEALQNSNLDAVLDGEIVVVNENGIADFESLQNWRSEADGEIIYYVFDVLWLKGNELAELPLSQRKEILNQLKFNNPALRISQSFDADPEDFLDAAKNMQLEGAIAKNADSVYLSGVRSPLWLKLKVQKRHEVVIGGYTKNQNTPKLFSALLVGVYKNGALQFMGKIGTGFNKKVQKDLLEKFNKLKIKKCPFSFEPEISKPTRFNPNPKPSEAIWLKPKLVCEVSYIGLSREGIMRHPSFKGIRLDKNAHEVHEELSITSPKASKKPVIKIKAEKNRERKTLLNPFEDTQVKIIQGHELKFNHLKKIFWPDNGYTKRDLLNYYYQIASTILPYLKDRPQSLNRFPNGINGLSFYQKDVTKSAPFWIQQFPYRTSLGEDKNFLVVKDEADLLWMANLGSIEMNPWNSTVKHPDYPTWCIIDIDPSEKNSFKEVIEVALMVKQVLDSLKIEGYFKTSGATGVHIYIPMGAKYTYEECQGFGRAIAALVHQEVPKITSIERYSIKRQGKIYVDFLQNRPKATLAAPYSIRPRPFAPVSMPLHWDEVKKGLKPEKYTIKNAMERIKSNGDIFKPVLGKGINLKKIIKSLNLSQ
ncbi:DNA ligase D [Criblamydia sequanensis]|uniref:DNA ligase (ATP) n=1 Tax=Candidatus Criblamydia sequanensis CRIB-18 TaxID=1437425 RepID=A0A090D0K9_9BACT|nr:DNA ligase D [Criblamydia sequanensis]CDR34841.1 DNA ligase [Criblamydia sequanensis CRIB-18]